MAGEEVTDTLAAAHSAEASNKVLDTVMIVVCKHDLDTRGPSMVGIICLDIVWVMVMGILTG